MYYYALVSIVHLLYFLQNFIKYFFRLRASLVLSIMDMLLPVMVMNTSLPDHLMVHMLLPAMGTDTSLPGPLMEDMLLPAMDTDTSLPGPLMVDMLLPVMDTDTSLLCLLTGTSCFMILIFMILPVILFLK